MTQFYDVIVIGGGPGGYVAAIRAAQLGMKVACVDQRKTLGGTCLNVGCIPSKALLYSSHQYEGAKTQLSTHGIEVKDIRLNLSQMMARKERVVEELTKGIQFLFKKNKVDFIQGHASFLSAHEIAVVHEEQSKTYSAKNFIIATGSVAADIDGIKVDEERIVSSTGALSLKTVPEHLVVIGGGYIGLELGSVWRRLGARVTVVEYAERVVPAMDEEMGALLHKALQEQGISFKLSTKVTHVEKKEKAIVVNLEDRQTQKKESLDVDVVLVSTGRRPCTQGLNLEVLGIQKTEAGHVVVNHAYKTALPHIYAIGDVIQGPMLAHKAEEEGVAVAELIAGQKPHVNYNGIPAVVYTHPEVACVGKTEQELKTQGIDYAIGKFPFSANSRARANGTSYGLVKILACAKTDEVLGVHIVHEAAGTMIAEAVMAMEYKASSEDIARTCHAHPTLSEALKEAALSALGRAIHA